MQKNTRMDVTTPDDPTWVEAEEELNRLYPEYQWTAVWIAPTEVEIIARYSESRAFRERFTNKQLRKLAAIESDSTVIAAIGNVMSTIMEEFPPG